MAEYVAINGKIAAKATGVIDSAANQLGDYEGDAGVNITTESVIWRGQSLVDKEVAMTHLAATMNFGRVSLSTAKVLGTLWGITATAGSTAETTPTTASIYNFDTSLTTVPQLEVLSSVERHDTNYKFQALAHAAQLAADFPLSVTYGNFITEDLSFQLFVDTDNDLIDFIWEV